VKINCYREYNCGRIFTISGPNSICPLSNLAGSLPNANAGAGQCTHMAARVGLLPHAILVSSRALPTPRARVPYPLPPVPSYLRHASSSASRSCRASPRFVAVRAMASGNPYAAELAAAKKAVTLAAKLCQVRGYRGPAAVRT
jgi:hypothetical protein